MTENEQGETGQGESGHDASARPPEPAAPKASPVSQSYTLPAMAVCPGCGEVVVLPADPPAPDAPALLCGTCETEVPDYRVAESIPRGRPGSSSLGPAGATSDGTLPSADPPAGERRYSRGGLIRSLGGMLAERGAATAKGRFPL